MTKRLVGLAAVTKTLPGGAVGAGKDEPIITLLFSVYSETYATFSLDYSPDTKISQRSPSNFSGQSQNISSPDN